MTDDIQPRAIPIIINVLATPSASGTVVTLLVANNSRTAPPVRGHQPHTGEVEARKRPRPACAVRGSKASKTCAACTHTRILVRGTLLLQQRYLHALHSYNSWSTRASDSFALEAGTNIF